MTHIQKIRFSAFKHLAWECSAGGKCGGAFTYAMPSHSVDAVLNALQRKWTSQERMAIKHAIARITPFDSPGWYSYKELYITLGALDVIICLEPWASDLVNVRASLIDISSQKHMTDTISQDAMLKAVEAITNRIGTLAADDGTFPRNTNPAQTLLELTEHVEGLISDAESGNFYAVADRLLDVAATCAIGVASMVAGAKVEEPTSTDVESATLRADEIMKNLKSMQ